MEYESLQQKDIFPYDYIDNCEKEGTRQEERFGIFTKILDNE